MHDFPGYALFYGWCTSGKMPCPVCMQALRMIWLSKGGKYVAFDLHRQFLPPDHPDREDKKNFTKGRVVHEVTEIPTFSGADVLAQLKALQPKVKGGSRCYDHSYYLLHTAPSDRPDPEPAHEHAHEQCTVTVPLSGATNCKYFPFYLHCSLYFPHLVVL